uniref:Uncharacterized protein n=1 Tax=Arundo donax TaxID=35708 RepID=A0A0A9FG49_ARUDO
MPAGTRSSLVRVSLEVKACEFLTSSFFLFVLKVHLDKYDRICHLIFHFRL